ncbi:Origin recognition complex subunit 2 [Neophaeococcomyces mojaviensis]|uniref:Origin recognition complex subunit 2 n=1 Tax=Neophaeococcomyces mojaviensis TaxID=3383035 RepID=A0ACC3A205_9EURO|nr:Origin recognition complex subunit 2 [Knufia sp. JES_112]
MPSAKKRKVRDTADDEALQDVLDPSLQNGNEGVVVDTVEAATPAEPAPETPSRRGRGRPKGAKNKRTPTPEGDIPPEERYFFQTRVGPANAQPVSTNSFAALGLLSHDDYLSEIKKYKDPHELEMKHLLKLHSRAFPQWEFELSRNFSVCLYGWGSKRQLVTNFAEHLCRQAAKHDLPHPKIVVINGYARKINIRNILSTVATVLQSLDDEDEEPQRVKLIGPPTEILDTLLARLSSQPDDATPIYLLINSLDHPSSALRQPQTQALISRLSSHPLIHTLITCDTPTFNLLFPSQIRDAPNGYNFVFHDATTFAPYEAETSVVDDVNELLGRKNTGIGGKEGVGFVLRSLPENARNLYRLLLSEILTLLHEDEDPDVRQDENEIDEPTTTGRTPRKSAATAADLLAIPYKTLYQKASEEFICSSDMNFRFLLKEFHDHQMLTTNRAPDGTEMLGVPLGQGEMEGVLEDLVI